MKIIAHRGANKRAPQNTMAAFKIAKEMKIDGFETDVHLTKDRKVVICHNPDIDATSNGFGFVNDYTYEELCHFDFGGYFSSDYANEKIPELSEFLDLAAGLEIINIEIKTPHNNDYTVVDETLRLVAEKGLTKNLLISSFDPVALKRVKDLDRDVKTGLLYDMTKKIFFDIIKDPIAYADRLGCEALHPFAYAISKRTVSRAKAYGMDINAWTVDDTTTAKMMHLIGATGLITDVPDIMEAFADI